MDADQVFNLVEDVRRELHRDHEVLSEKVGTLEVEMEKVNLKMWQPIKYAGGLLIGVMGGMFGHFTTVDQQHSLIDTQQTELIHAVTTKQLVTAMQLVDQTVLWQAREDQDDFVHEVIEKNIEETRQRAEAQVMALSAEVEKLERRR